MRKWLVASLAVLILATVGGTVMASGESEWNFENHLPFMQNHHPNLSDDELEQRFNECSDRHKEGRFGLGHGMMNGGMMGNDNEFGPGNVPSNESDS
ncbi:hypothetical protein CR194_17355 [Salipaludibacillus keqinensis]|uniref:FAD/FMN-containing dehydrogenase n=1 Tax=Salipaludibacillus keqinensis TaxID=2045207 RepID=A0A323TAF3_9BACI|nr:hypothetical protein [Salipaludibacillus keqinensis]PYZ91966.1 hypothetical protein CR194_17355 [Salipaludibacillus keqinensis]